MFQFDRKEDVAMILYFFIDREKLAGVFVLL